VWTAFRPQEVGSCEHGNESSGSKRGGEEPSNYQLLEKDSVRGISYRLAKEDDL
jgi:hypothetical protein